MQYYKALLAACGLSATPAEVPAEVALLPLQASFFAGWNSFRGIERTQGWTGVQGRAGVLVVGVMMWRPGPGSCRPALACSVLRDGMVGRVPDPARVAVPPLAVFDNYVDAVSAAAQALQPGGSAAVPAGGRGTGGGGGSGTDSDEDVPAPTGGGGAPVQGGGGGIIGA